MVDEIVHADYYINKLIRQGSSEDFKSELEQISALLQGVLDSYDSKKVLVSEEPEEFIYNSTPFDDGIARVFFTTLKVMLIIIVLRVGFSYILPMVLEYFDGF